MHINATSALHGNFQCIPLNFMCPRKFNLIPVYLLFSVSDETWTRLKISTSQFYYIMKHVPATGHAKICGRRPTRRHHHQLNNLLCIISLWWRWSFDGHGQNVENQCQVFCWILMRNQSAKYPLSIFRILHFIHHSTPVITHKLFN